MKDDSLIHEFHKSFDESNFPAKRQVIIIKINGNIVRTSSGKAAWTTIGHAKNALRHHCWKMRRLSLDQWHKLIDTLQERKILEFVSLDCL
jgi:hypothetical protein